MNESAWVEVERLFAEAAERVEESEVEAWVRGSASSAPIAEEVLSLLRAHLRTGLFDPVVDDSETGPVLELPVGTRLGPWEVSGTLGRGGMGVVYRVRRADGQFDQEAALKILHAGVVDDESKARFLSERQILARLSHPNIARLFDGGISDDGRPWFVMEPVAGRPIDVWCEEMGLSVPERLRLLRSVCGAVQHAHQQLVVHRDIKPANVLVDSQGVPKLLDFGIAGVTESSAVPDAERAATARYLTPGYSSPEQLRGEPVTTASDVYQLGLLMRRMLARSGSVNAGSGELVAESGDLGAIVAMATREDPLERYDSPAQLADDLERYVEGEPVRAHPRTWGYVAGKFARRHALPLAVGVVAVVLLVGATVQIQHQATAARLERDRAREVVELLVGLFQAADPLMALDDSVLVRDVLDRGVSGLRDELADQPALRASLLSVIAEVYASLGVPDQAVTLFGEALALGAPVLDALDPELTEWEWRLGMLEAQRGNFVRADTFLTRVENSLPRVTGMSDQARARALNDLGYARQVMGDLDRAEALLERSLAAWARVSDAGARPGATYTNLGWIRVSRADPDSAKSLFRRGLEVRRSSLGPNHPATATSLEALGAVLLRTGALQEADSAITEALRIREALVPPEHPLVQALVVQRAGILRARGAYAEAEQILRGVLIQRTATYGDGHFAVASTRNDLALTLVAQGRDEEAEPLFRASLDGYRAAFGDEHRNTAILEVNLARLLMRTGQGEEAERRFGHAVPILREAFPAERIYVGDWVSLGFLRCAGGADGGLPDLEGAVEALRDDDGTDARLRALNALADCHARTGNVDEALRVVEEALEESASRGGDDPYRAYALALRNRLGG